MLARLFLSHPHSVGESYLVHARTSAGIGTTMLAGGIACLVHAVVPALFVKTGSTTIKRLYARLRQRQPAFADSSPAFTQAQWQPEYEI